jgi:hypothetical protein
VTVYFRRLPTGEIIGEIVGDGTEVLLLKNFGALTDEEISRILAVFRAENPEVVVHPIKLISN